MLSLSQYLFPRLTQAKQLPLRLRTGGITTVRLVVELLGIVLLAIVVLVMIVLLTIVLLRGIV